MYDGLIFHFKAIIVFDEEKATDADIENFIGKIAHIDSAVCGSCGTYIDCEYTRATEITVIGTCTFRGLIQFENTCEGFAEEIIWVEYDKEILNNVIWYSNSEDYK